MEKEYLITESDHLWTNFDGSFNKCIFFNAKQYGETVSQVRSQGGIQLEIFLAFFTF